MRAEINESDVNSLLVSLNALGVEGPKILSRALNKTADKAKTLASRAIREQVALKAAYVKGKLNIRKANPLNLRASLGAEQRGVLMTQYTYSVLRRGGVTVKIKPTGARAKLPKAFVVNLKAGSKTVPAIAVRDPSGGRYSTGNAKIIVYYSPSISQVFNSVRDDIKEETADYLKSVTDSELAAYLRGF